MKLGSRGSNQPLAGSPASSVAMWQHLTIGVQFLFDSDLCSRPSSLGGIFESAHQATLASEAALLGTAGNLAAGIVDAEFGKNVTFVEPVNLYGCAIGEMAASSGRSSKYKQEPR